MMVEKNIPYIFEVFITIETDDTYEIRYGENMIDRYYTSYRINGLNFQQQLVIMENVGINDIYEGDIVDFGGLCVVKYDEDRFYVGCGNIHTRVSKQHKVIGNIYENPELL